MSAFKKAESPFPPGITEEWRPYSIGRRIFLVSNVGRVRTSKMDYVTEYLTRLGYRKIWGAMIHRMVAELFVKGRSDKNNVVNHIDAVKTNNHYVNLEWTNSKGNSQHAQKLGLYAPTTGANHWTSREPWRRKFGDLNGRAKLRAQQVLEIRSSDESGRALALKYAVTPTLISAIRRRKIWRHI